MKANQLKEVLTVLSHNQKEFKKDPSKYVPFGIETLDEDQLDVFDAEMDKLYFQALSTRS